MYNPENPLLNHVFRFDLTECSTVKIQVFDRCDTADATSCDGSDSVLMAEAVADLKPWIANGRFQGELELCQPAGGGGGRAGKDLIQLDVKITYPKALHAGPPKAAPIGLPAVTSAMVLSQRLLQMRLGKRPPAATSAASAATATAAAAAAAPAPSEVECVHDALKQQHLVPHGVPADGNCLFAAVSRQLFETPAMHAAVREQVCPPTPRTVPVAFRPPHLHLL